MQTRRPVKTYLLVGMLALAACSREGGDAGGAAPGDFVVNVTMTEFAFEVDRTDLPVGVPITFVLTNDGAIAHDATLELVGAVDEPLDPSTDTEEVAPGDSVSFTYTFEEGGSFQLGCHIAGHYEAGMVTELNVTDG